ncbi:hypothetical protein ACFSHQ_00355 [Gemmobacter lanyuensis]
MREVILKDGRRIAADEVVICAGAHSTTLARELGNRSRWKPNAAITRRSWPPAFPCAIRSSGPPAPSW